MPSLHHLYAGRAAGLWMNFPEGLMLHDTRFVGDGFRERERIKRKRQRWLRMFAAMPPAERQVIGEALAAAHAAGGEARASPRMTIPAE